MPLLPWQAHVITDASKVTSTGAWASRMIGVTVARQNGKTHLVRMRILAGLFLWGERSIIAMSQNRMLSLETFRQVVHIIDENAWLRNEIKRVSSTNGQEYLELKNGATYSIVAASADGPRGRTADLLYVDELRQISEHAWAAARPLTRAVKNPQTWVTSNAGDLSSTVLNSLRARALAGAKGVSWYEWSADPILNIHNKKAWQQSNPALGHLISVDEIESAAATDHPDAFRTETLCLWVDVMDSPWSPEAWQSCTDPDMVLEVGRPTFGALDVSLDRRTAALVGAQVLDDGRIGIGLVDVWTGDHGIDDHRVAADIATWAKTYRARSVAYDKYTGMNVAARLTNAGITTEDMSGAGFAGACDELLAAMNHQRIAHSGQDTLTAHMYSCARKPAADGGWRIVRRGSSGPIAAAVATVMCHHLAAKPYSTPTLIVV